MSLDNGDTIFAQDAPAYSGPNPNDQESWQYWATQITGAWQSTVASIIKTGKLLSEAETRLSRGEFDEMIRKCLPFKRGTALKLMKIARNPVLSDASHVTQLPAHWGTLAALDRLNLPAAELEAKIGFGKPITARMERKDVAALKPKAANAVPRESPMAKLKQEKEELKRQILDLKSDLTTAKRDAEDGSLFGPRDSAARVATVLASMNYSENKIDEICKLAKQMTRERGPLPPPKPKVH